MSEGKRTPLYPLYAGEPGVRCIDFGGWELPVQFTGIVKEHEAVRKGAGLFDVSHMGEFVMSGAGAEAFLQRMTTNDVSRLTNGQAQYSLMCFPDGGTLDDLLVYRLGPECYMLVVNASNIDKDYEWLEQHAPADIQLEDRSAETALLALQGPAAAAILDRVTDKTAGKLGAFHFMEDAQVCGYKVLVSRTGYTGEDGFEIYCRAADATGIWSGLLEAGGPEGLVPAGLGARDTLRFEARLPLYGQELSEDITPLEAGLGFFVKLDKAGGFIGRDALQRQKQEGLKRRLAGIEMVDRSIPRSHYPVYDGERQIGEVTTGAPSPTLKKNLGLALLDIAYTEPGTEVWVDIRGKKRKAVVVKTPFYRRTTK